MAPGLTRPLTEMIIKNISCGVRRADNLTTSMCRVSWNLGASTSWKPEGLSRPVMGLLYLLWAGIAQLVLRLATGWTVRGSNPGGRDIFRTRPDTDPGAHPASYIMGTGSFPGLKRPERSVDHSLPSSAEVKVRVKLYPYSPSGPSWSILGSTLPWPSPLWRSFFIQALIESSHRMTVSCLADVSVTAIHNFSDVRNSCKNLPKFYSQHLLRGPPSSHDAIFYTPFLPKPAPSTLGILPLYPTPIDPQYG
jgi:hypothetical protein